MNNNNEDNNELKQLSKDIKSEHYQYAALAIDDIAASFEEDTQNKAIPEEVFVEHFLPVLERYVTKQQPKPEDEHLMLKWFDIAEGPYNEVDVIDGKGNTIFTVPKFYNNNAASIDRLKNVDFTNQSLTQQRYQDIMPQKGENYANKMIQDLPKFIKPLQAHGEEQDKWKDIFIRYKDRDKGNKNSLEQEITKAKDESLGLDFSEEDE